MWLLVEFLLLKSIAGGVEFHSADETMKISCTQQNALHALGQRLSLRILPLRSRLRIGRFGDTQYERATQLFFLSPGRP